MATEYSRIPEETLGALNMYVLRGRDPGGFLYECLRNRFVEAATRADDRNKMALREIALYIYNRMPSACWRDENMIRRWMEVGGLIGKGGSAKAVDLVGPLE